MAKEAARLARKVLGHEVEIIWFGSWPLGRAQARSDIDLAMAFAAGPISLERMAVLREVVDNFPTLYEIDLVDLASVGQSLRTEILLRRTGIPLQQSENDRFGMLRYAGAPDRREAAYI